MLKRIQKFLFYKTSSDNNSKNVRIQIMEENRRFAIIWAIAQLLYWTYCLVMSTRASDFMTCQNIYIFAFSACAVALILAIFAAPRVSWLIPPVCFIVDCALLGAGIGIARFLAPKTIIIFASVLIVPVFFICNNLSTLIILIVNAVVFSIIGKNSMEAETFRWTLLNMIIFSSVGFILGYFVNKARFERYYYAESAIQLAESNAKLAELQTRYAYIDQMTGLHNRRAFEEKTDQYINSMPSDCCVIMADINGLKKMNDTCGHNAGDELIIGSAECLRQSFHNIESIYRIGGDEFCVIMSGTEESVEECLKELEKITSQWRGEYVNGISISYGFASHKEFADFDSMLKTADKRMYAFKRDYYMGSGHDRRHR